MRPELVLSLIPVCLSIKEGRSVWGGRKLPKEGQSVLEVAVGYGYSSGKLVPAHPEPHRQMQKEAMARDTWPVGRAVGWSA